MLLFKLNTNLLRQFYIVMQKHSYIYILSNNWNNVIYIGITSDLIQRVWEHKNKFVAGFTKKYNVEKLVYYEEYDDIFNAILREKQLKKWRREWKLGLIEKHNPDWKDLYKEICH